MTLCDTNIFIQLFNGNEETLIEFNRIGRENVIVSSITVMELYQGMGTKNELDSMKKKIKYFDIIEVDPVSSRLARKYIEKYNLSHGLNIPDAFIAATAVTHKIELFTYNLKDFHFIPGLKIYQFEE